MVSLNKFLNNTRSKIDELEYGGEPRDYLGLSGLGFHCIRSLFLRFHWSDTKKHSARMQRIFDLGHEFEKIIISQLKDSGFEVFKMLPNTQENNDNEEVIKIIGDQLKVEMTGERNEKQESFIGFEKYVKGHPDGRILGIPEAPEIEHLLEIKTMKESFFKELCKKGIKKSHNVYYGQAQSYMREMKLKYALFIVINKNTSHIYTERIKFNQQDSQDLKRKEITIVMSDVVPEKPYQKGFYKCDLCFEKEVCHGDKLVSKNCRTCRYCDIIGDGLWACSYKDDKVLSVDEQRLGCDHYSIGWGL